MRVHKKWSLICTLLLVMVLASAVTWASTDTSFGPDGLKNRPESLTTGVITLQSIVHIEPPSYFYPAGATFYQAHVDGTLNLGSGPKLTMNDTIYVGAHGIASGPNASFVPENRLFGLNEQMFVIINNENGLIYALAWGAVHVAPDGAGGWTSLENNDSFWLYGQTVKGSSVSAHPGHVQIGESEIKPSEGAEFSEDLGSVPFVGGVLK